MTHPTKETDSLVSQNRASGRAMPSLVRGLTAGLMAVYVMIGASGNAQSAEQCQASQTLAQAIKPLVGGPIAALQISKDPTDVSDLKFKGPDGSDMSLADFKGKAVLLNLWATWCAPCKKEMPDLDELQTKLGGDNFEVVAVNIDRKGPEVAQKFLDKIESKALALYSDPSMKIFHELKKRGMAFGMPTTLVLDKKGCALGFMAGPAAWSDERALELLGKVAKEG
ncbi:MAG: TlpA family protein disulfide reductase [Cohaesibacter sp.]|jgi:thiol-disulfide isomerase/thioredoxin|nr:TlpA family protein disulfide reductase [Cohaesibacter sp.]